MWLSGSNGTQALLLPASGAAATTVYRDSSSSYAALAYSSAKQEIALGNASKLVLLDASSASTATASAAIQFPLRRWLWVTNISTGAGGELDDVITALVYDDTPLPAPPATEVFLFDAAAAGAGAGFAAAGPFDFGMPGSAGAGGAGSGFSGNGTLYIGNPTALNIMYPDGTVARIDGMGGLPWGNITSIAVTQGPAGEATPGGDSRLVVIGTTMGVAIYDPYGTATVQNGPYGAWGQYPYAAAPPVVVGSGGNGNGRQLHSAGGLRSGGKRAGRNGQRSSGVGAAATTAAAAATPVSLYYQPAWRYLLGPRWLPCTPADTLSSVVRPKGVLAVPASVAAAAGLHLPVGRASEMQLGAPSASAGVIVAVTDAGASVLQTQMWHVADKATLMEALLPPHIVDGQINDCSYPSFGVAATCTWGPGANDGLWSSLVVASESFRYAVTGDADARDRAWQVFGGMKLLNDVTGITGLIARAAVDASFPPQPPADGWHNSSSLPGYQWMGDASSDEVAGHSLAYPIMASLVVGAGGNATEWATVTNVLRNLARYITVNNFTLVDVTGLPTHWGHWDPATINGLRDWSDGRGINSLEILGLLAGALRYSPPGSSDAALFTQAIQFLAYDNDYAGNLINLRINAPVDINYSDDELEFVSYLSLFFSLNASDPIMAPLYAAAVKSIRRSWATGTWRSRANLWGTIYLAATGGSTPLVNPNNLPRPALISASEAAAVAADILWNLRTWSVELADWPTQNSHRLDLAKDPNADRFGNQGDATVVLPMYEREQGRWNADPFSMDGGGGTGEGDPGVWLMPYWMARFWGVLGAAQ